MAAINFFLDEGSIIGGFTSVLLIPSGGPSPALVQANHRMSISAGSNLGQFVEMNPGGATEAGLFFTSVVGQPNVVLWAAGIWTIVFEVGIASPKVTWRTIHVCRIDSAGTTITEIGSNLAVGLLVSPSGTVLAPTVTVSESSGLGTDRVHVVLGFSNSHNAQSKQISTINATIQTTTIDDSPGGGDETVPASTIALTATVETAEVQALAPITVNALTIALSATVSAASVGIDVDVDVATIAMTATVEAATVSLAGETVLASTIELATTVEPATIQSAIVVNASVIALTATVEATSPGGGGAVLRIQDGGGNYIVIGGDT